VGHVAHMEVIRNKYIILDGKTLQGRDNLGDISTNVRI
jgi:hypothetical protein